MDVQTRSKGSIHGHDHWNRRGQNCYLAICKNTCAPPLYSTQVMPRSRHNHRSGIWDDSVDLPAMLKRKRHRCGTIPSCGAILGQRIQLRAWITPFFSKAIANENKYLTTTKWTHLKQKKSQVNATKKQICFYLPLHPIHPMAEVKRAWQIMVLHPTGNQTLNNLTNTRGALLLVSRMVMCYSRLPNIGNMLFYRKKARDQGRTCHPIWIRHQ